VTHPLRGRWYKIDEGRPVRIGMPEMQSVTYWVGVRALHTRPTNNPKGFVLPNLCRDATGRDFSLFNDNTLIPEGVDVHAEVVTWPSVTTD
jgi:hypothetical protein